MKERPILFSAPMVRAILEGRKTMTRRIVKPQPPFGCRYEINGAFSHALCIVNGPSQHSGAQYCPPTPKSTDHRLACPYGQPGDRLWVKETCRVFAGLDGIPPREIREGSGIFYEADGDSSQFFREYGVMAGRIRQSIFMRRWMSRITLEITGVRVERLQDISEEDAIAEGVIHRKICHGTIDAFYVQGSEPEVCATETECYQKLWDKINGPGSWDANPWVWVVEFKRLESEVQP